MHLHRDSAAGVRFLAAVLEGRGVKPSAGAAGVGKETGYRWLREAFGAFREQGLSILEAQAMLGYSSALVLGWDEQRIADVRDGQHHLAVEARVEDLFWERFAAGDSPDVARRVAGVGHSTAYRWLRARFVLLRRDGIPVRTAGARLRIPSGRVAAWEAERRRLVVIDRRESDAAWATQASMMLSDLTLVLSHKIGFFRGATASLVFPLKEITRCELSESSGQRLELGHLQESVGLTFSTAKECTAVLDWYWGDSR